VPRIAIIASHPIQYQAPWFQALARVVDVEVFYCHRLDGQEQVAAGFGHAFEWDIPLLDGYSFRWLTNVSREPGVERFGGCDTPELYEILARGRFDGCIVNGWYLKSYLQAVRACWKSSIPVMMRGDSHLQTPRRRITQLGKYWPYRWMLSRADAHLYVGRANYDYLRYYRVDTARLFFAPHFVDNDRFSAAAAEARSDGSAAALRARIGATDNTMVCLFAGKLIELKRPGDFLDVVARLHQSGEDVRGVVVGSGPLEQALAQRAREKSAPVAFLGFHNQTAIATCYAASDCLVLPSDRETWGLVVNEAMACGLPAIVSDAVGCREDLIDEQTGATFSAGNVDALTEAIAGVARRARADRTRIKAAVAAKISHYTCAATVAGTLQAMEYVTQHV
jgi:glycosyltransferase involved in cell wall biosynthesis